MTFIHLAMTMSESEVSIFATVSFGTFSAR